MHLSYLGPSYQYEVTVEFGLLHSRTFTKIHFHFLIIVESATSEELLQRPKQQCSAVRPLSAHLVHDLLQSFH